MKKNILYILATLTMLSCDKNPSDKCNFPYFIGENKLDLNLNQKAQRNLREIIKCSGYESADKISNTRTEISYELTENAKYFYIQFTRLQGSFDRIYYTWVLPIKNLKPNQISYLPDYDKSIYIGNGDDGKKRFFLRVTSVRNGQVKTTCESHSYTYVRLSPEDMLVFKANMISFLKNYKK